MQGQFGKYVEITYVQWFVNFANIERLFLYKYICTQALQGRSVYVQKKIL